MSNTTISLKRKPFDFAAYTKLDRYHFSLLFITFIDLVGCFGCAIFAASRLGPQYFWFTTLDTWTYQTSAIISIFTWIWFFKVKFKKINLHAVLMALMTYIFVTCTFFNTYSILLWSGLWGEAAFPPEGDWTKLGNVPYIMSIVTSSWNHTLNPVLFLIYGFLVLKRDRVIPAKNGYQYLMLSMIYPSLYALYLIYIPWSGFLDDGSSSYSVYGFLSQTKYNPESWLWFPWLYSIFPTLQLCLWFINSKIINKPKPN